MDHLKLKSSTCPETNDKKKPCGHSLYKIWNDMYNENKFYVESIFCFVCFGAAIIMSRLLSPNILNT